MYGGKRGDKNIWVLLLLLLAGVVLGGFIGEYAGALPYMKWLAYGQSFGFDTPIQLNLGVIMLQFAIKLRLTIAGILGITLAFIVYRRL